MTSLPLPATLPPALGGGWYLHRHSVNPNRMENPTSNIPAMTLQLGSFQAAVDAKLQDFNARNFTAGFWQKQADLWVQDAEAQQSLRSFMGWLRVAETMLPRVGEIEEFAREIKDAGFQHVVVMGMGGSTMTPIVFKQAFQQGPEALPLSVLDTTNPATVRQIEESVPLAQTLFVVASKSGTTAEPWLSATISMPV
ncbi:hypothetical protein MUN84_19455 [Hymenobacter sp. 5516J-16]|uniref:hypothetical protein n=1 Tax=Hymenobacter sp. 5516J-16 TaxID=2932253 RepID=UPI001FD5178C|nr:hypothetical protein [Hymenobacter sp. 5516J-16]UOQ76674.1 hypothetical protein MUN84_19455 [Hymenobacter sp. 5516J-16]